MLLSGYTFHLYTDEVKQVHAYHLLCAFLIFSSTILDSLFFFRR